MSHPGPDLPSGSVHPAFPGGDRRSLAFVLATGLLMAWGLVFQFVSEHYDSLYDDAYIYFRYVDNIVAGCGITFNCGAPPVEGFTSPLYLALLTLGQLAFGDLERTAQVVGTLACGGAITISALSALDPQLLPNRRTGSFAACVGTAAVLGVDHFFVVNAVIGMETALACLAVSLLYRAVLREAPGALAGWAIVAVLLRPECALFVAAAPLLRFAWNRRFVIPVAVAAVCIAAVRWHVFGSIAPNTYWAKAGGTARHFQLGVEYIAMLLLSFPVVLASPLALWSPDSRSKVSYALVVAAGWLAFFLRSGGDAYQYSRLFVPIAPVLTTLGVVGMVAGADRLRMKLGWPEYALPRVVAVPLVLLCAYATLFHHMKPTHGFEVVQRWAAVGRYLAENHPDTTIATVPIGAIGYYSRLPLIDLVGLTEPAISRSGRTVPPTLLTRGWIGHERHNEEWVLEQAPDLIVTTKWQRRRWRNLSEAQAGFYADWLIVNAIQEGRAPYRILSAEVEPGVHWLMFRRTGRSPPSHRPIPAPGRG